MFPKLDRNEDFLKREYKKKILPIVEWKPIDTMLEDAEKFLHLTAFMDPVNRTKNRSEQVPCWDHTRIHLSNPDPSAHATDDYIHANYVNGFEKKKKYIMTQSPLPETVLDFFKMVDQYDCEVIVALTEILEDGQSEVDAYWPTILGSNQNIGNYIIRLFHFVKYPLSAISNTVTRCASMAVVAPMVGYTYSKITINLYYFCGFGILYLTLLIVKYIFKRYI
uniref:protein-tyrosine-phosphatase n=1 Tax=Apophua simplicipes ichnovirus TaxID=1329648 RepID=S5DMI7_9VIRU|nr:AsIV-cont00040-ORF1 [Apophua simplicipes ichnovirus]